MCLHLERTIGIIAINKLNVKSPQTSGICECLDKTVWNDFYQALMLDLNYPLLHCAKPLDRHS